MPEFMKKISSIFLDLVETLVIGLSFFLIVYLFLFQPHQVNGRSMYPTLNSGDYLLTDKISYKVGDVKRGDVIVFHAPPAANCPTGTGCDFIKRVLALPGDSVEVKDNGIYVNSTRLNEPYIPADFETMAGKFTQGRTVFMGPNEYFAVGDNRPYSSDSRVWGPITKQDIVGKAIIRYWPLNSVGAVESADYAL